MKLNKIENQIKKSFQEREIKPSPMAWDRLDAMLSVAEQPKKRLAFKIWHYAAVLFFVAIITWIGSILINPKTNVELPIQEVVEQNAEIVPEIQSTNKALVLENETESEKLKQQNDILKIKTSKKVVKVNAGSSQNLKNEVVDINDILKNSFPINQEEKVVLTPKAAQLLAAVENFKIDENLKNQTSQIEISSINVDAKSLLEVSEKEVNHSFRSKVIKNINKVSTALVNRNLE